MLAPLACVFLVMAVGVSWQWLSLSSDGIRTSAVVVQVHDSYRGPGTALVDFVDADGRPRQSHVIVAAPPEVGSTVQVIYSPTDPDAIRLDDDLGTVMVLGFFWFMGGALAYCTWEVVRRYRRRV